MTHDLAILVADKNMDYGLRGLLGRPRALGTRPIDAQIWVHPRRDPGCRLDAHHFLRSFAADYRHALVMFDRDGCGSEASREQLEREVEARLSVNGWGERAAAVVVSPELETWVFTSSPHVERCLDWPASRGRLRDWLARIGQWPPGQAKPGSPREALEHVLRESGRPRSAALYQCLGARVSLRGCSDAAFQKLLDTLKTWFPPRMNG